MSRCTEEAYVAWMRRFIFVHDKRHPAEIGVAEVTKFLTSLAVDGAGDKSDSFYPSAGFC